MKMKASGLDWHRCWDVHRVFGSAIELSTNTCLCQTLEREDDTVVTQSSLFGADVDLELNEVAVFRCVSYRHSTTEFYDIEAYHYVSVRCFVLSWTVSSNGRSQHRVNCAYLARVETQSHTYSIVKCGAGAQASIVAADWMVRASQDLGNSDNIMAILMIAQSARQWQSCHQRSADKSHRPTIIWNTCQDHQMIILLGKFRITALRPTLSL